MKRIFCSLAALFLMSLAANAAAAGPTGRPLLLESDQTLFLRDADDFLNLDSIRDDSVWPLLEPLYADGGAYTLQLRSPYGSGSLSAEVIEGDITVEVTRLRPENEPLRAKYTYYAVTLVPPPEPESEAEEEFSVLLSCGEMGFTLKGTLRPSKELPVLEGMRYPIGSGTRFRFEEELEEEPARIHCAPGLTLSFLGDYGEGTYNLKVDTAVPSDAEDLFGTGQLTCYSFTERPSFESGLTVHLKAPEDATIYELRNGRLYEIDTLYEDACHIFKTQVLGTYLYQHA